MKAISTMVAFFILTVCQAQNLPAAVKNAAPEPSGGLTAGTWWHHYNKYNNTDVYRKLFDFSPTDTEALFKEVQEILEMNNLKLNKPKEINGDLPENFKFKYKEPLKFYEILKGSEWYASIEWVEEDFSLTMSGSAEVFAIYITVARK